MADTFTLELNDCAISVSRNEEERLSSPGFALINGDSLEVGDGAYGQARLHPRQAHNQFWHRLSLDALVYPTERFRHQADLAYAHLLHIADAVEEMNDVIVAVPSHYSREQLSLLLGIATELPLKVRGLVDASVAAVASQPFAERCCYLDLQLHQSILVSLEGGDKVKRLRYEALDRAGLASLYENWIQLIANAFVDQCRFDPLHSAATEQALYNQLPQWLGLIDQRDEVVLELESEGKRFECRLKRNIALQAIAPTYARIVKAVESLLETYGGSLFVSHRFAALPGMNTLLPKFKALPPNAVASSCTELAEHIYSAGDSVNFVTALPAKRESQVDAPLTDVSRTPSEPVTEYTDSPSIPTHVLKGAAVYPLSDQLLLGSSLGMTQLSVAGSAADLNEVFATLLKRDGRWVLSLAQDKVIHLNQQPASDEALLKCGDQLALPGSNETLTLVREIADGKKAAL